MTSNCCSAPTDPDQLICSECKEHCEGVDDDDPTGLWILGLAIVGSVVLGISLLMAEGGL
jgi:hypothetical protein